MASKRIGIAASLVLGATFIALGGLELSAAWIQDEWIKYLSASGNIIMGLVLVLTGAVFLAAAKGYRDGVDGDAFVMVACMLALFVGVVALLTLTANAAEAYLLNNEDFVDWVPLDDLTPAIIMMIPCAGLLWYQVKAVRSGKAQAFDAGDTR